MIPLVRAGLGDERSDGWGRLVRAVEEALRLGVWAFEYCEHRCGRPRRNQASIVDVRNVYMHEAGAFPAIDSKVQVLVSEMHACLAAVSRL
jgi:hypothetical protein